MNDRLLHNCASHNAREHLMRHVEQLFVGTTGTEDMLQEILLNTLDRYDDLVAQGKAPEAAYQLAIGGLGDIPQLLADNIVSVPPVADSVNKDGKSCKKRFPIRVFLSLLLCITAYIGISIAAKTWIATLLIIPILWMGQLLISAMIKRKSSLTITGYYVGILILIGFLLVGVMPKFFMLQFASGDNVPREGYASSSIRRMEINWNGGQITIRKGTSSGFSFNEMGPDGCWYKMDFRDDQYTLTINYSKYPFYKLGKTVDKNLNIVVPANWNCEDLVIHSNDSTIIIEDINLHTLTLNGRNCEITYSGAVTHLDANSAYSLLTLNISNSPEQLDIDGIGCSMDLKLPTQCGFSVKTRGIGCKLNTTMTLEENDGRKVYGNGACAIEVNGHGCNIAISENGQCLHDWSTALFPTGPDTNILIYVCNICGVTKADPMNHEHLWEEVIISESSIYQKYICSICGITKNDPVSEGYLVSVVRQYASVTIPYGRFEAGTTVRYRVKLGDKTPLIHLPHEDRNCEGTLDNEGFWVFTFTMPEHDVLIVLLDESET